MVLPVFVVHTCEQQIGHMYAERGPRVTDVNTLFIITLQNIDPNVRNESRKHRFYVHIIAKKWVHYIIIICNQHTINSTLVKSII